ncbi:WD40 repeat-like protein [Xylona heveae TC161]|uniref:WD40 repeat-like protein n=1 Tax=Xylona heveae (strain CBS 132557 / TC161) TaxID=1328760 RepID=A0A165IUC5_XYLHT|nr:WD40 repeat-like protein [Xylona heveae TC161]KZF25402.1 WD40 repeat-like protein [Xylona heveae TC161]
MIPASSPLVKSNANLYPNGQGSDIKTPFYGVAFYPYTAPGIDPIFAVTGGRETIICRPLPGKQKGAEILQWFRDEDQYAGLNSCVWSRDLETGEPLVCVAGTSPKVKVINVKTGQLVQTLIGHGNEIEDLAVSPSSPSILASASMDHSIRIWSLDSNHQSNPCNVICAGEGHKEGVLTIAFHHTGRYLVSGGMDCIINLWALPELPSKNAGSDKTTILHYPHFSTMAIHSDYVDCIRFFDDLILSKSAQEGKIVLWKIDGFSSGKPFPNPETAPTSHDFRETKSAFGEGYQRLLQFEAPQTELFYMRFGFFDSPGMHPVLSIGNTNSKVYFWDLKRFEVYNPNGDVPFRLPIKRGRRPPGIQRETSIASTTSSSIVPGSNDGQSAIPAASPAAAARKYDISDPFNVIEAHSSIVVPKVSFAARQIAWSVGGEWMVVVGDNGVIALFGRELINR